MPGLKDIMVSFRLWVLFANEVEAHYIIGFDYSLNKIRTPRYFHIVILSRQSQLKKEKN